jgi:hypothetical protein
MDWHVYNLTGFTNTNTTGFQPMLNLVQETSKNTSYLPGAMILVSLWLVLFFALRIKGNPAKICIASASWACTMVALIMYPLGILSPPIYITFIAMTPISVLLLFLMDTD